MVAILSNASSHSWEAWQLGHPTGVEVVQIIDSKARQQSGNQETTSQGTVDMSLPHLYNII